MRHAARGGDSDDEDGERDENDGPVAAAGAGAGAGAGADRDDAASDAAMLDMPCTANAFDTLLQHMCIGVPDRAEPRSLVVASAVQLADVLPPPQQRHWVRFLVQYSRNKKPLYRQCAVEVSAALLLAHSSVLSAPNSTLPASSLSAAATPSRNGPSSAAATPLYVVVHRLSMTLLRIRVIVLHVLRTYVLMHFLACVSLCPLLQQHRQDSRRGRRRRHAHGRRRS
jgi:hypothetical protein